MKQLASGALRDSGEFRCPRNFGILNGTTQFVLARIDQFIVSRILTLGLMLVAIAAGVVGGPSSNLLW